MWNYVWILNIFVIENILCNGAFDPCTNSSQLPYMTQRLVNYKLQYGELPICDGYLNEAWYEMGDYVLSNTTEECGTAYNWYINSGQLPEDGKISNVTVCRFENPLSTCSDKMQIGVMNCGNKFIFHLKPLPGCDEAFCIQRLNKTNNTDSDAPDISSMKPPVIKADIMKVGYTGELIFYCDFEIPSTEYLYVVEWSLSTGLSTTRLIYRTDTKNASQKTTFLVKTALTEEQLRNSGVRTLGFTIVCSVVAKKGLAGAESKPSFSQHKFCGIEVLNRTVNLVEEATVYLRLTVPYFSYRSATVRLEMLIPNSEEKSQCLISNVASLSSSRKLGCGIMLYPQDVDVIKHFKIGVQLGQNTAKTYLEYGVMFKTMQFTSHPLFSEYAPDVIRVFLKQDTTELSGISCYAHSDPHIKTFDGRKYDNHKFGVFTLYKNENNKTEVQIQTDKCPNYNINKKKPLCTCGVAVRSGRDVFVMNHCFKTSWDINFKLCDDKVLHRSVKMEANGKHFRIQLPTGASVKVSIGSVFGAFAEVDIYPSLHDKNKAEGLCGNFNKQQNDDISKLEIVPGSENLFHRSSFDKLTPWNTEIFLCNCNNIITNGVSTPLVAEASCFNAKRKKCDDKAYSVFDDKKMCSLQRKKRSDMTFQTHSVDTYTDVMTDFQSSAPKRQKQTVFKRSVFTNETAYEECIRQMNTSAFRMCTSVPDLNLDSYIDNCVADATISGSMFWTRLHIEKLNEVCVKTVEENQPIPQEVFDEVKKLNSVFNFTDTTDPAKSTQQSSFPTPPTTQSANSTSPVYNPELLKALKSVTCPNACSDHGKCVEGVCTCDKGFINTDCSVAENEPPIMKGIPDLGLCDIRERNCLLTSVFGDNFVSNKKLSCRLTPMIMESSGNLQRHDAIIVNASLRTFEEVTCPLPFERRRRSLTTNINDFAARGYQVAVANDGVGFSEADVIVIFDTECVSCNKTKDSFVCRIKPGFCQSDGMCYSRGEQFGCYMCSGEDPASMRWTSGPDCPAPVSTPDDNGKLWITGATVGPVLVILIGLTVIFYIHKKKQIGANRKIGSVESINRK